jgi:hypothetical protein
VSGPSETAMEGAKAATAAGIVGVTVAGITLQDWAALTALLYTLWLLAEKATTTYRKWRAARGGQ